MQLYIITMHTTLQEDVGRTEYLKIKQSVTPDFSFAFSGLVVSVTNLWLAASPDGLVYDPQAEIHPRV